MCDCTDHKDEIPAYDAQAIESRWMKAWEDSNLFAVDTDDSKPKKYVLEMFPYPSGDLHMGHARNYTIGDAMARQARMRGYDVLHPIGFDAFGLPAENAAIKHNTQAAAWTYKNMDQALATMKRMGFSYDLDRMVKTCSPDYYRWGQWIFEKLWEKGLVYRKKNPVNWCPTCKTVLANEQVTEGKCWRCGTEPEKRDLEQWYFKITEYSQELLDDLEKLPGWPERVKQMQANWIGRSEGAEVDFTLCDQDGEPIEGDEGKITVFTTRADTLFGVSFFVLAPEYAGLHELVEGTGRALHIAARHAGQNHVHQPVQPGTPLDRGLPVGFLHFVHVAVPRRGNGLSAVRRVEIQRKGVQPLLPVAQGDHVLADQPVERHARGIIRQGRKRLAVAGLIAVQLPEGESIASRSGGVAGIGAGGMALQYRRAAQVARLLAFFRPPQPVGRRALKRIHVDAGHSFLSAPHFRGASRMLMPAPG